MLRTTHAAVFLAALLLSQHAVRAAVQVSYKPPTVPLAKPSNAAVRQALDTIVQLSPEDAALVKTNYDVLVQLVLGAYQPTIKEFNASVPDIRYPIALLQPQALVAQASSTAVCVQSTLLFVAACFQALFALVGVSVSGAAVQSAVRARISPANLKLIVGELRAYQAELRGSGLSLAKAVARTIKSAFSKGGKGVAIDILKSAFRGWSWVITGAGILASVISIVAGGVVGFAAKLVLTLTGAYGATQAALQMVRDCF